MRVVLSAWKLLIYVIMHGKQADPVIIRRLKHIHNESRSLNSQKTPISQFYFVISDKAIIKSYIHKTCVKMSQVCVYSTVK